jgi:hypothetical protein
MADILKYVIVDENDVSDDHEFDTLDEAKDAAQGRDRVAIIERVYVYDDSWLMWTSTGGNTWPPEDPTYRKAT